MIHTFSGLYNQVLRALGDQGDSGNVKDVAKDYINQAQQLRLSEQPWPFMLWDTVETFTTSSASQYALHSEYARPLYFLNRTTQQYLQEVPFRNLDSAGDNSQRTSTDRFSIIGRTPVEAQPTSSSAITIVSSSGSDTGASYQIVVKGIISSGTVLAEVITPSGTTPVVSSNSFSKILGVTKAGEWNGTLTMTSNAGAVTNLVLSPTEMGRSFPLLQFHGSPVPNQVIEYRFYRQPLVLVNDYDVPEIPAPFSQILVWDALMMFAAYNDNLTSVPLWQAQQAKWELAMNNALAEAQSIGAEPRFVRNLHDPVDSPEFHY